MQWFDLEWDADFISGVLVLSEHLTPPGMALKLHIRICCGETLALWMLEDGQILGSSKVGEA